MKYIVEIFAIFILISSYTILTSAQTRYRNQRKSSTNEPAEQGRTLGLIRPLLGLGLNSIVRPFVGYDSTIAPNTPYRPSSSSGTGQSDPYYGNYGYANYGGYIPNYFNRYNYYGGYPLYRPSYYGYPQAFYGVSRPQAYPNNYHQFNGYGNQRPLYSSPRPRPVAAQPPVAYPSTPTIVPANSGTVPAANTAQAAQIANLLGQLLGQQLRPLLNQGAVSAAHDDPGNFEGKRYRNRYY